MRFVELLLLDPRQALTCPSEGTSVPSDGQRWHFGKHSDIMWDDCSVDKAAACDGTALKSLVLSGWSGGNESPQRQHNCTAARAQCHLREKQAANYRDTGLIDRIAKLQMNRREHVTATDEAQTRVELKPTQIHINHQANCRDKSMNVLFSVSFFHWGTDNVGAVVVFVLLFKAAAGKQQVALRWRTFYRRRKYYDS